MSQERFKIDEWTDRELLRHIYREVVDMKESMSETDKTQADLETRVVKLETQSTVLKWALGVVIGIGGVIASFLGLR